MSKCALFITGLVFFFSAGLLSAEEGWRELKSSHFIIYYDEAPRGFVDNVQEAAERYYTEILEDLGFQRYKVWSFDDRAKIYIYNDKNDYVEKGQMSGWSHGSAQSRTKEIRTFPSSHGFLIPFCRMN